MKLTGHRVLKGTLRCETGLHIGGSAEQMEIGGVDSPIIKHPITKEPYIPGSSLKGKMRSELEKRHGKVTDKGLPCGCGRCEICKVFGSHMNTRHSLGPTRILVRDASLSDATSISIEKKVENVVNRHSGTAEHPRSQERVPSGAEFNFEIVVQLFDSFGNNPNNSDGDGESILNLVKEGLSLVQASYLGGFGSRGSGKVSFVGLNLDGISFDLSS